jgi:ornithine cyclodeaminase/alanine dehydrogenase-like protein (mu-crystallin family)
MVSTIEFAGSRPALVRESDVRSGLSLRQAIEGLTEALRESGGEEPVSMPRVRIVPREKDRAWLHTLRAGAGGRGIAGGKDYTSIGFDTPSLWVTVVSQRTGRLLALVEAEHLSRLRTAAVTAVATDLLAPPVPRTLAHFGVGKISEQLIRGILEVRPSVRQVFVVRRREGAPPPEWLAALPVGVEARITGAEEALADAEIVTTATSSKSPVIPAGAAMPRLRHLNLVGSNHPARREIDADLARRCLPPRGLLAADDPAQAAEEAGDFRPPNPEVAWETVPSLARLARDPGNLERRGSVELTAFKSVGIGLMDLLVAAVLLANLGVLPEQPHGAEDR